MTNVAMQGESRSWGELNEHYVIEKDLAAQLRNSSKLERTKLYSALYNELFQRVPSHPQLTRKISSSESEQIVKIQMDFLSPFLAKDFSVLELGPGDCSLSLALAERVKAVYAVDVSDEITRLKATPDNFHLIISDGSSIPVAAASIDLAYSNQLMEHLHPEDAFEQLTNIYQALKKKGTYICVTPNRLSGPHDISKYFDPIATGFHLKEYTTAELTDLFKQVGFTQFKVLISVKSWYFSFPLPLIRFYESWLQKAPTLIKRLLMKRPFIWLLGIRLVAVKG